MELLDRYLHSVRQYLPEAQQDDIIRELSENIRSQREDKEAELEAILKQLGHPMLMAGRYLPHKHLIGPAVFPYYWFTLKGTLWIVLLVYIVAACTTPFVAGIIPPESGTSVPEILKSPRFGMVVWGGITVMFAVFGILTIVFALLDRLQARCHLLDKWNPRQLMPVPKSAGRVLGEAGLAPPSHLRVRHRRRIHSWLASHSAVPLLLRPGRSHHHPARGGLADISAACAGSRAGRDGKRGHWSHSPTVETAASTAGSCGACRRPGLDVPCRQVRQHGSRSGRRKRIAGR